MQRELIEMLDKMVKYFDEIPSDSYYYRETASILNEAEALVEKAKNCVREPAVPQGEPVTLTDSYAGVIAWVGDKQCKRVLTEGAIKHEHTPGVAMRNTAHQCVQEVIIAALREKE